MENTPRNVTGSESSETVNPQAPAGNMASPRRSAEEPVGIANRAAPTTSPTRRIAMKSQELLEETDTEEPLFEHTESQISKESPQTKRCSRQEPQAGEMVTKELILLALIVGVVAIAIMLWHVNKTKSVLNSPQDDSKADNKGNEGHGDKALIVGVVAIAIMLWHVNKTKSVLNSPQDDSKADNKGNEGHGDKVQKKPHPCPGDALASTPQPEPQVKRGK
nr:uncharacterized protein LOC101931657 [Chrysemys picta bellii]